MSGEISFDPSSGDYSLGDNGSLFLGSDNSFNVPKTADTATTNAIGSMAPITGVNTTGDSGWSSFWQQTLGGVIQTATKVAAVKNGVQQVPANGQQYYVAPASGNNTLLLLIGAAVVIVLATHKG